MSEHVYLIIRYLINQNSVEIVLIIYSITSSCYHAQAQFLKLSERGFTLGSIYRLCFIDCWNIDAVNVSLFVKWMEKFFFFWDEKKVFFFSLGLKKHLSLFSTVIWQH